MTLLGKPQLVWVKVVIRPALYRFSPRMVPIQISPLRGSSTMQTIIEWLNPSATPILRNVPFSRTIRPFQVPTHNFPSLAGSTQWTLWVGNPSFIPKLSNRSSNGKGNSLVGTAAYALEKAASNTMAYNVV